MKRMQLKSSFSLVGKSRPLSLRHVYYRMAYGTQRLQLVIERFACNHIINNIHMLQVDLPLKFGETDRHRTVDWHVR